ncbi:anaerobic carbon-monoxide dehydrogenase catalytic subunit [Desulfofundulus thermosubterraneus]|uniref:anaerobic carbon-monoxide dehydrogenase n=1 Tax=Desulfofundulus thermosubterraneus DSM 16057 TaxID=1121432 RepID=A0A1M6AJZ4_9FIRM|nr:anaerobic carbon-monoxide dehydrogenase catalytic subunit [Desulfofundulus thermosubterraneus]SHI36737.1 Ni-dependent carbon monoxide dehydrogenase precursor [Desulfofundulus thermosubterraneus DSM 16057]
MKGTSSIDPASLQMLKVARDGGLETAWDRYLAQQPQCGFGELGLCCRNCNMGPCRIDPFGDGPQKGVCGATGDIIVARNLLRMIAAGAAAHSDHGRDIIETLRGVAAGEIKDYTIKDENKLKALAREFGISTEGETVQTIAEKLAEAALEEFGTRKGYLQAIDRVPPKRKEIWEKLGIMPRGIDREVVEAMHRTHFGVDNDPANLILHGLRCSLSDGWGGSLLATEFSDVLFGTPRPVRGRSNLGVLSKEAVNILVHGHEPILSEMLVEAAKDPGLISAARAKGASGINLVGMCCTGNEILMRHGIPVAGNFLQQELAVITGALEAVVVDVQCIMPALGQLAACYHTKFISTSPKAKFPGAIHIPFDEHNALETAREIIRQAIENYPNRDKNRVFIPEEATAYVAGFSVEAILSALGGTLIPLIEAVKNKKIRGIAALVGCNNPKVTQDYNHVNMAKALIARDVLVVETGCAAIASAKAGLLLPEAAELAGAGLAEVCRALGVPPVLHMGSCVDISRILTVAAALARELGVDIADLPVAGSAPEWMSEKAVSIGAYVVASGIFTVLGTVPPVLGSNVVADLLTKQAKDLVGGYFAVETDPFKAAELIIAHIDEKRAALGI